MKKLMLICAPVSSRSGYGDHARDLVRAFLKLDKFNVKILDVNWGETPRNALDNELDKNIIDCIFVIIDNFFFALVIKSCGYYCYNYEQT